MVVLFDIVVLVKKYCFGKCDYCKEDGSSGSVTCCIGDGILVPNFRLVGVVSTSFLNRMRTKQKNIA